MTETVVEPPWLLSFQAGHEEQIFNYDLPTFLRAYHVAAARCGPNLHHPMQTGELGKLLGQPRADGSLKPVDRHNLGKYIKRAIDLKYLDKISSSRCLVLREEMYTCRLPGNKKPCEYHTGVSSRPRKNFVRRISESEAQTGANVRTKRETALSLVGAPGVVTTTPQCGANNTTNDGSGSAISTPTPGSRDILGIKPAGVITPDVRDNLSTGHKEGNTCVGCREFGTDGCHVHSEHYRTLMDHPEELLVGA